LKKLNHYAPIETPFHSIYLNDWDVLNTILNSKQYSSVFIITDENTAKYCLHIALENIKTQCKIITISPGEENKNIETCLFVWQQLLIHKADRHALIINLGGGVTGDLGGFCAATFMRGIDFIQVPTTLLSQVDASIGGKVGVDLLHFKNMIGAFALPKAVFIFTSFLKTLPEKEIQSGLSEIIKHLLIADRDGFESWNADILKNEALLAAEIYRSVKIKQKIVELDPNEKGSRKVLNFGHTIGHAIETVSLLDQKPLLHGEAVAIGMICESYISYRCGFISEEEAFKIKEILIKIFGHHPKKMMAEDRLLKVMYSDKKNSGGQIRFSLLEGIGKACFDQVVSTDIIKDSLLFYQQKS